MGGLFLSKMPPDPIDSPQGSIPAETISIAPVSKQDLDALLQKDASDNKKRNLRVAQWLVVGLVGVISASYIFNLVCSVFMGIEVKVPNEILSILQAALFTLLGYLFGEKNAVK